MQPSGQTGEYQGVPVLYLAGVLDLSMKLELQTLFSDSATPDECLIIDFSKVTFVDSSPLGLLIELDGRLSSRSGALAVTSLQPDVRRIFQLAGLFRLLKVFDDNDKAAAYLRVACGLEAS